MSAVNAPIGGRIGLAQRLGRIASGFSLDRLRPAAVHRVAAADLAPSRTETLLRRHLKGLGEGAVVIEIGHVGAGHADWLADGIAHRLVPVSDAGRSDPCTTCLADLPAGSVDAVFSVDTIEYVRAPWRLADDVARVLKPGGVTFHTTVFTTRYQPQPEDFFRYTPEGLKSLFSAFDCLTAEFDATERRRAAPAGRRDAGADIFGGSREGWRVHYAGRKMLLR
ncbi:methyltransferase domain-containing protein [Oharaeibacter diazotrophicus]|uniref:Methyltransferase family protein n=1 Tax=Oharaeibacter diazotrophicus TaxID=1920512 RepID=A0A4R6RLG8_9HYPH|nr:methyltransferase domain-containing protein [Oharaeibacter diazotrophicus]TDP86576.1 methyltransferase family protein [Oharaeibacter diazotrophicus]BBE71482.1 methyltransferase domain protein [Pleomorphomonas sp. SM30]GLS78243.1 hypothetical protein GCM10007904_35800 [Oharaeibacter diazotrophicus]